MRVQMGAFEIRKRGAARFDLRDPYHLALSLSWPQFALAFLALNLAINLLFATLYLLQPGCVANARPARSRTRSSSAWRRWPPSATA